MTNQTISLALEKRSVVRKRLSGLRRDGKVPAVIHDHGKDSVLVEADYTSAVKTFSDAGKHHPVNLTVGDKKYLAIIKDAHFEPVKRRLEHVVFQAIKQNEKVTTEVPLALVGDEIPAEKKSLLVLKQLDTVEVEALPKDLPDQLTVDATVLAEVGDHLSVADIIVPAGVTILTDPSQSVAAVEMPKDQIAEADAAAEALAADAGKPAEEEAPAAEADAGAESAESAK